MSDRAKFFRSLSFLYHTGAIYTLRYILNESISYESCQNRDVPPDHQLLVILDHRGIVLRIASHIACRLGHTTAEMYGKNFYNLMPWSMRVHQWPIHCEVVRTGKAIHFHEQGIHGHQYDALFMPIALGGQVRYVLGFATEERQFTEILPDGTRRRL